MHAKVTVKLLVFTTFLANYTHLLKTKNRGDKNKHCEYFEGSGSSKYPGIILQLIWQNPSNALHTKGLTIIKTKNILNLICWTSIIALVGSIAIS